jgi:hypothetical protein
MLMSDNRADAHERLLAQPALRRNELWIPAAISVAVGLRWILGERHSVYGDEAFHLSNLFAAIAGLQGTIVDRLVSLYLFNFAYPPVFHLLSAPFVLPAADPVLGGRIYTQVLTLLVCLTLYSVTRLIGGRIAGGIAVLTLLGMPSYVDVSRHYLLEPLLTLEVLLILYLIGRYYARPRAAYVAGIAALITLGLLTKFNFFFYAAPLFIVPAAIEFHNLLTRRRPWTAQAALAVGMVIPPVIIAGPWYLARAAGSTDMLGTLYEAGTLKAGLSFDALAPLVFGWFTSNYSLLFRILAVAATLVYACHLFRVPRLKTLIAPVTREQHVVLSSALIGILTVPVVIAMFGLGRELRWHIEAVYLVAVTCGIIGRMPAVARLTGLGLAFFSAVLQLLAIYGVSAGATGFSVLQIPALNPRPSAIPIGSEELASDIARYEKRTGATKPGEFVFFFYHEHAGPHFGSVEFYLRMHGTPLATRIAGFYDRAIDVGSFFEAKYLVEGTGRSSDWNDPENQRYKAMAQHLPPEFRNILVEVSDVEGRFGRFKAYYVPRERITREMVMTTIDTGRRLETVEPYLTLWDAQRIIWRARFESIPGNSSLRTEIDAVLPRMSSVESTLTALNRTTLEGYTSQILEIRRLVDTSPSHQ